MTPENLQLLALLGFVAVGAGLVMRRLRDWQAEAGRAADE